MEPVDNQKNPDQKEQNEEDKKSKPLIQDELFYNYIQSFQNKSPQNIINDKKFKELTKDRKFWKTQPVLNPQEAPKIETGPLEEKKTKEQLEKVTPLPENFEWTEMDLAIPEIIKEVYQHLYENYVEDEDGYFRFNYSEQFLQWALMHPGYKKELFFGVRDKTKNNELVGFISGIVLNLNVEDKIVRCTEVNFLCVNKKYRNHYMAAVLIREVVRRSNILGIWQGLYTSGTMLPTPIAQTRYWHRSLNPEKLINCNFSYLPPGQKISTRKAMMALPKQYNLTEKQILRPAEVKDMKQVRKLLQDYINHYKIRTEYSKKDFQHFFVRRENILESFVIETNGVVTDFFSFYCLPSTVLKNPKYKEIRAAYSYYFVPTSMSLTELYRIALIKAKELDYDVFNTLDIMRNGEVFEELLFTQGDGFLQYYLYNWKLKQTLLKPEEIGIVLMQFDLIDFNQKNKNVNNGD